MNRWKTVIFWFRYLLVGGRCRFVSCTKDRCRLPVGHTGCHVMWKVRWLAGPDKDEVKYES